MLSRGRNPSGRRREWIRILIDLIYRPRKTNGRKARKVMKNNIMKTMYFYGTEEHINECVSRVTKNNVRAIICNYVIVVAGCLFGATIATSISALVFGNINTIVPIIIGTVTTALTILSYVLAKKVNSEISELMGISIQDEISKKMDGVFGRLSLLQ